MFKYLNIVNKIIYLDIKPSNILLGIYSDFFLLLWLVIILFN
jgi:hypothetical protein